MYATQRSSYLLHAVHSSLMSWCGASLTIVHALLQKRPFQGSDPLFKSCCVPCRYVLVHEHKVDGIYACAFAVQAKNCVVLLNFIYFQFQASNYDIQ